MYPVIFPNGAAVNSSITIAHISDPHLSSLDQVGWRELLNKRILGYFSWRFRRRHIHRRETLSRVLADLATQQPDHLVISGDLTHLGTARECAEVATWLRDTGTPDYISIVPGNHDCYAADDPAATTGQWRPYMQGDAAAADNAAGFPYLRRRGPAALIGLSSALPTAPFFATGKLGEAQLQELARLLEAAGGQGLYRVVVLHHGPQPGLYSYRRRLADAERLLAVMEQHGAELILHGHGHRQAHAVLGLGDHSAPVFGVPSASAHSPHQSGWAGYNLYRVSQDAGKWLTQVEARAFNAAAQEFQTVFSREFITSVNTPQPQPA